MLPDDGTFIAEYQTFPGFPGEWKPGEPVAADDLGLEGEEAAQLIKNLGLPLRETRLDEQRATRAGGGADETASAPPPASGQGA